MKAPGRCVSVNIISIQSPAAFDVAQTVRRCVLSG
jgi:hypothetical protein